jgi:hypothetical protein
MASGLWTAIATGCLTFGLTGTGAAAPLPLGDGKISSSPRQGYLYSCQTQFNGRGAFRDGPWISGSTWDPDRKVIVDGEVDWPNASIDISVEGDRRVVRANNLPLHPTGVFPIQPDDDAYQYDRNPNAITGQDILLSLPANPEPAASPSCVPMGMIGFALSGVAIFNSVDAEGRDAPAHEIQDLCNGHPERGGQYHYHDLSGCQIDLRDGPGGGSSLFGYALDGFGIYGPYGETGERLSNADLDECHGHVTEVMWDGKPTRIYHYHFTDEYPYAIGCFGGTPESLPRGP